MKKLYQTLFRSRRGDIFDSCFDDFVYHVLTPVAIAVRDLVVDV